MNKYRNKPITISGQRFASQAEALRWSELRLLQIGKYIEGLRCQPRFPLIINGKTICTYVGDFYYREGDKECVEDVKGFATPVFQLKASLFKILHPTIELRIISKQSGRRGSAKPSERRKATGSNQRSNSTPS